MEEGARRGAGIAAVGGGALGQGLLPGAHERLPASQAAEPPERASREGQLDKEGARSI